MNRRESTAEREEACRVRTFRAETIRVGLCLFPLLFVHAGQLCAESTTEKPPLTAADRGYEYLTEKSYLPGDFDQETFDNVWKVWPRKLKEKAARATPEKRRIMAYDRYGLTTRPGDDSGKPLQYVVKPDGTWTMNCFSCHGGSVNGEVIPGLPNANFELETLTEEIRLAKLLMKKPLTRMDVGGLAVPLGTNRGLTNAIMFGVGLMAYRDKDLNLVTSRHPQMINHDVDPPPWWNYHKRPRIYIDGYAERGTRGLMPFMMVPENGPEKFREWESDFEDIYQFISSLRAPKYPFGIDASLAEDGKVAFAANCAECHGTYGAEESYPGRIVPIDEIGTDPVRLTALTPDNRKGYGESWFAHYGEQETITHPVGYQAPPLNGVWASAPYFHNGSVPTLRDVLFPADRPDFWRRSSRPFDRENVGLSVDRLSSMPRKLLSKRARRHYFDTTRFGKSNGGHEYPEALTDAEKRAVLEYLKTL